MAVALVGGICAPLGTLSSCEMKSQSFSRNGQWKRFGTRELSVFIPAIPSTKKERKVTTSNRPFLTKSVHKQTSFQDGDKSVRQWIMANDWAISLDLTDTYLHVPIHPISRKYLRFVFEHQVFQFTALPLGMSLSPWIFTH